MHTTSFCISASARCLPAANLSAPTHTGIPRVAQSARTHRQSAPASVPCTSSHTTPTPPIPTRKHIYIPPARLQHLRQRNRHRRLPRSARRQAAHAHHRPLQTLRLTTQRILHSQRRAIHRNQRPCPRPPRAHGFTNSGLNQSLPPAPLQSRLAASSKTLQPALAHSALLLRDPSWDAPRLLQVLSISHCSVIST